jgi:hypothetical protein
VKSNARTLRQAPYDEEDDVAGTELVDDVQEELHREQIVPEAPGCHQEEGCEEVSAIARHPIDKGADGAEVAAPTSVTISPATSVGPGRSNQRATRPTKMPIARFTTA